MMSAIFIYSLSCLHCLHPVEVYANFLNRETDSKRNHFVSLINGFILLYCLICIIYVTLFV